MSIADPVKRSLAATPLEALYSISKALNSTLEVKELFQTMLDMALPIFSADAGSVMLVQEGYLTIEACHGLDSEIVANTRQKIGVGVAGWVAQTAESVQLDGKVGDPRFQPMVERSDSIESSLAVPILLESKVEGVLMIRRSVEGRFREGELGFLQTIADLAGVALQRARLFESEREQRHQFELTNLRLNATLASMADGVLVFDQAGTLLTHNREAEVLLEHSLNGHLESFFLKFPQCFGSECSELLSGERIIKSVSAPLVLDGKESGSVIVLRDETKARELDQMKSEFLSMISHELKTPITTISAFVELLQHRDFERERVLGFLKICGQECSRLQSLIDQLLNLTRLETGNFTLDLQESDLNEIISESLPAFQETNPKHTFEYVFQGKVALLSLDKTLMAQAVVNLLSNAVKYSPEGGRIQVELREIESSFLISVRDEGVGIDGANLPLVFEKFFRADNSLTRATGGSGLGLANVKNIALAHGGKVWAESVLNKGSTFYLELPRI